MNYLVDIVMCVYNHEKFIAQAMEGVILQKTNFNFRLLIGEDASKDNSRQIILDYEKRYPNKIFPFFHQQNLGMQQNASFLYSKCISKYIALCDGDDYWTDPLKLQKQIDFLQCNSDYNICYHNVNVYNEGVKQMVKDTILREVHEVTDAVDLSKGNYIHTPSVIFRNNFVLPKWFDQVSMGDWVLYMIVVKNKKIRRLDDCMAVYRLHNESIWSNKTQDERDLLTKRTVSLVYKNLNKQFSYEVNSILRLRLGLKRPKYKLLLDKFRKKIFK